MHRWGICVTLVVTSFVLLNIFIALPCYSSNPSNYNLVYPDSTRILDTGLKSTLLPFTEEGPAVSASLKTDKPGYLTGEDIQITCTFTGIGSVNWVSDSFKITIKANVDGSSTEEIVPEEQLRGKRTYNWKAPSTPCSIIFSCNGQATYQTSTTTFDTICMPRGGCFTIPITVTQDNQLQDNADVTIQVYDPKAPIAGTVMDKKGKPVSGAIISLSSSGWPPSLTDEKGAYSFTGYTVRSGYKIINNVPAAEETISVQAVACEPVKEALTIPAASGVSNANFTMTRYFYPASLDLSKFKLDVFSSWAESSNVNTWQNMMGITLIGPVEITRVLQRDREITTLPFTVVEDTKLFMVTKPQPGRYFVDIVSRGDSQIKVAAAATIDSKELENGSLIFETKSGDTQRVVVVIDKGRIKIEKSEGLAFPLLIILPILGLAVGLLAAYLITGGKMSELKTAVTAGMSKATQSAGRLVKFPSRKTPAQTEIVEEKTSSAEAIEAQTQTDKLEAASKADEPQIAAKTVSTSEERVTSDDDATEKSIAADVLIKGKPAKERVRKKRKTTKSVDIPGKVARTKQKSEEDERE